MKEKLTSTLYLGALAVSLQFRALVRHLFCFPALNKLVSKLDKRAEKLSITKKGFQKKERVVASPSVTLAPENGPPWAVEKEKEIPRVQTRGHETASTSKTRKTATRTQSITADNILNDLDSDDSSILSDVSYDY